MTAGSCFWSLLSKDNFRFLYMPMSVGNQQVPMNDNSISDLLLQRSLFDIMHPNDAELARHDLSRFLKLPVLAGSVTRCRLLSSENMAVYLSSKTIPSPANLNSKNLDKNKKTMDDMTWNVVDLVLYTVTNNTVLAFFHNFDMAPSCVDGDTQLKPNCNENYTSFMEEDGINLLKTLESLNKAMAPNSNTCGDTSIIPLQIFQVINKQTMKRVVVWPQFHSSSESLIDMILTKTHQIELKEFKNSSFSDQLCTSDQNITEHISCSQHFYANSKIEILDKYPCNFQRILIPYGNIYFESLRLTDPTSYPSIPPSFLWRETPSRSPQLLWNEIVGSYNQEKPHHQGTLHYHEHLFSKATRALMQDKYILLPPDMPATFSTEEVETLHQLNGGGDNTAFTEPGATLWFESNTTKKMTPSNSIRIDENTNDVHLTEYPMFQKFRIRRNDCRQEGDLFTSCSESVEKRRRVPFLSKQFVSGSTQKSTKTCARCYTTNSPEWRRGPDGHKTLCNACGLRYSRYRSKQWNSAVKQ